MMRDLFEAGLNEAAGSLAASYGRWSFAAHPLELAGWARPTMSESRLDRADFKLDRTNGNRDPKSSVLPFDNNNYVQVTLTRRHGSRLEVAVGSWRTIR